MKGVWLGLGRSARRAGTSRRPVWPARVPRVRHARCTLHVGRGRLARPPGRRVEGAVCHISQPKHSRIQLYIASC